MHPCARCHYPSVKEKKFPLYPLYLVRISTPLTYTQLQAEIARDDEKNEKMVECVGIPVCDGLFCKCFWGRYALGKAKNFPGIFGGTLCGVQNRYFCAFPPSRRRRRKILGFRRYHRILQPFFTWFSPHFLQTNGWRQAADVCIIYFPLFFVKSSIVCDTVIWY